MPPVKTVASSADVDTEATAELPVLDVAAYEATLNDKIANTDTWVSPSAVPAPAIVEEGPVPVDADAIPTLRAADSAANLDLSGTHEMPPLAKPNKIIKATPLDLAPAAPAPASSAIIVPPSPPLIEEWRNALAAAERRIEELIERMRIGDAERAVAIARATTENAQLRAQLGVHLESLQTSRGRLGVQEADQAGLEDELFARGDRIEKLQSELATQAAVLTDVRASLEESAQRCERLEADVVNLRASLARRDSRIGSLEADLVARQQREASLHARLTDALAAADADVPDLRAQIAARDKRIQELIQELAATKVLATEKDADLQVAEESIRNLELEVRDKTGKLEEVSVTVEEWRAVIAESQRSILQRDSRIQQLEADLEKRLAAAADSAAQTGEEVALEGPARVLIRTDGNTDFVHVLGRRTRIGRGSDNEVVLDTKHVSRYHAVLLAGPNHTTIEDLKSTNGVFVNGKRVARHTLKDGDRVTIGKTHFRYSVRN
ncbi:MAG TPA: FHA domain-containing protein [Steroidobacteraceae bacterium]|jgi:pSer/pThr/pTyr-binding forkhead associated (FHA) protein|nr:FHA domain-containing protein [Steroidobacteraceae bacterium]